jgi:hypothetical protein
LDRRRFIQTTVAAAGALKIGGLSLDAQAAPGALEKTFQNPPDDAEFRTRRRQANG